VSLHLNGYHSGGPYHRPIVPAKWDLHKILLLLLGWVVFNRRRYTIRIDSAQLAPILAIVALTKSTVLSFYTLACAAVPCSQYTYRLFPYLVILSIYHSFSLDGPYYAFRSSQLPSHQFHPQHYSLFILTFHLLYLLLIPVKYQLFFSSTLNHHFHSHYLSS